MMNRIVSTLDERRPVLVCVDLSSSSPQMILTGLKMCRSAVTALLMLHVFTSKRATRCAREHESFEELGRLAMDIASTIPESIPPVTLLARYGDPVDAILRVALEENVGTVVMGLRARHGWRSILFGSKSSKVLRRLHRPLLFTSPKEDTEITPPFAVGFIHTSITRPQP